MSKKLKIDICCLLVFYFICLYVVFHVGYSVEQTENPSIANISTMIDKCKENIFNQPLVFVDAIQNKKQTMQFAIGFTVFYLIYMNIAIAKSSKYRRKGEEHGSARLARLSEYSPLKNKKPEENIILSKNVRLSMNERKTERNLNCIAFGGAGTKKSRGLVIPNILQMNTSFVVTDPKGSILKKVGSALKEKGYDIKVFNLVDMEYSNRYNPFKYLEKEEDVFLLIDNIIENTDGGAEASSRKGDPFWENSEKALLNSVIFYLLNERPEVEQRLTKVLEIIQSFNDKQSPYRRFMKQLEQTGQTGNLAYVGYATVMLSGDKTLQSILVSSAVRLSLLNTTNVKQLLSDDELELGEIGEKKTALFIIIPDTSKSFNFLVSMLYTQAFQKLVYRADASPNERLKIRTQFFLDEFANVGKIPNFDILISTVRSRGISMFVILQNLSQLKTMYEKSWETIMGNCDSLIFLGGKEQTLLKYLSEQFGKETIIGKNRGTSKSKQATVSYNDNMISRSLLTIDELETLNNKKCIVSVRGFRPIIDDKFDPKQHKNYKLTGEYSELNTYHVRNHVTRPEPVYRSKERVQHYENESMKNTIPINPVQYDQVKAVMTHNGEYVTSDDRILNNIASDLQN